MHLIVTTPPSPVHTHQPEARSAPGAVIGAGVVAQVLLHGPGEDVGDGLAVLLGLGHHGEPQVVVDPERADGGLRLVRHA